MGQVFFCGMRRDFLTVSGTKRPHPAEYPRSSHPLPRGRHAASSCARLKRRGAASRRPLILQIENEQIGVNSSLPIVPPANPSHSPVTSHITVYHESWDRFKPTELLPSWAANFCLTEGNFLTTSSPPEGILLGLVELSSCIQGRFKGTF